MSPKTILYPDSAVRSAHLPAFVEALATVYPELVAMPREEVLPIGADVQTLLHLLPRIEAERVNASEERRESLDRLELLARAFAAAQLDCLLRTQKAISDDDRILVDAERLFRETEELVDRQVDQGRIPQRRLPRAGGTTLRDRSQRALHLIELLREHRIRPGWLPYRTTEAVARRLLHSRRAVAGELTRAEIRERAYTALRRALAEYEQPSPAPTAIAGDSMLITAERMHG